jgi:hypothetical protein
MYCVKCGAELLADAKFCTTCGDAVVVLDAQKEAPISSGVSQQQHQVQQTAGSFSSVRLAIGIAAALLLSGIAYWFYVEKSIVREPNYRAGNSWSFAITETRSARGSLLSDILKDSLRTEITFKVTSVNQDGRLVATTSDRTFKQDMIFQGLVRDDHGRGNINEDNDRDEKILNFPLSPEKSWESSKEWTSGKYRTKVNRRYLVENWETVTVPAGTFRALPIKMTEKERVYLVATGEELTAWDSTSISWFSPEVKSAVKSQSSTSVGTTTWELKSFSLN